MNKIILIGLMLILSGCGTTVKSVIDPVVNDISDYQQIIRDDITEAVEDTYDRMVSVNNYIY